MQNFSLKHLAKMSIISVPPSNYHRFALYLLTFSFVYDIILNVYAFGIILWRILWTTATGKLVIV